MKLESEVMQKLLKQLWFQSDNCLTPIQNIGIQISEVHKITGRNRSEIVEYLRYLIAKKVIRNISEYPLLYEFTDFGKRVKTLEDIEKYVA